jgi:hypothetical protein
MMKLFLKWFKKSNLEFHSPYSQADLNQAYESGFNDAKEAIFSQIEENLRFYPVGGVCRPILTKTEIEKIEKAVLALVEENSINNI